MTDWNEVIQKMNQRQAESRAAEQDYTRYPEVLAACGIEILKVPPADLGLSPADGEQVRYRYNWYYGEMPPVLTMQELWEGLCRVCRETGWFQPVLYGDAETLISGPDPMGERVFKVNEYGSLPNTVAAALHWVLQQKREG